MKRERKQSRLQWFALDVDAFLEDERMMELTGKEKGQWALMLIKSWHKGFIPDSIDAFRNLAECTKAEAEGLRKKLLSHRLLVYKENDGSKLESPRLAKERIIALSSYNQKVEAGVRSAEERAKRIQELEKIVNDRSTNAATPVEHNKI